MSRHAIVSKFLEIKYFIKCKTFFYSTFFKLYKLVKKRPWLYSLLLVSRFIALKINIQKGLYYYSYIYKSQHLLVVKYILNFELISVWTDRRTKLSIKKMDDPNDQLISKFFIDKIEGKETLHRRRIHHLRFLLIWDT